MKRFLLALSVLLTISLSGCGHHQAAASSEETIYHSDTSAGDCLLCGEGTEASYWGQENVALISLNTVEIKPIEINRYDRLNRQLIEEYAGVVSFGGGGSQNGGFSAAILLEYDRGYATGLCTFMMIMCTSFPSKLCGDLFIGFYTLAPIQEFLFWGKLNLK